MLLPPRNTAVAFLALAAVGLSQPRSSTAQSDIDDFSLGSFAAEQFGLIADGMRQANQGKAAIEGQLARARRAYWNAYPDGPGLEDAERELAYQLFQKDLTLLGVYQIANTLVGALMGEPVDGGIPEPAQGAFIEWVNAIRVQPGGSFMGYAVPRNEVLTHPDVLERYREYARVRDFVEYYRGPYSPARLAETPEEHIAANFTYWGFDRPDEVATIARLLTDAAGAAEALRFARRLTEPPHDPPRPYEGLSAPLRRWMKTAEHPAAYRNASIILEGFQLNPDGRSSLTVSDLEQALLARYTVAQLDEYTRALMERDDVAECGSENGIGYCFQSILAAPPSEFLARVDEVRREDEAREAARLAGLRLPHHRDLVRRRDGSDDWSEERVDAAALRSLSDTWRQKARDDFGSGIKRRAGGGYTLTSKKGDECDEVLGVAYGPPWCQLDVLARALPGILGLDDAGQAGATRVGPDAWYKAEYALMGLKGHCDEAGSASVECGLHQDVEQIFARFDFARELGVAADKAVRARYQHAETWMVQELGYVWSRLVRRAQDQYRGSGEIHEGHRVAARQMNALLDALGRHCGTDRRDEQRASVCRSLANEAEWRGWTARMLEPPGR